MAETLRKSDTGRTGIPQWLRTLVLFAGAGTATFLPAQRPEAEVEKALEAAIYKETVLGDLAGAMQEYKTILAQADKNRELAARALFQMGQCQEKLGHRAAAQSDYRRVATEYSDQTGIAAAARSLAAGFSGPRNLNFEEGVVGKAPAGWTVPVLPKDPPYSAELRRNGCPNNSGCAVLLVSPNAPWRRPFSTMIQSFNAEAYRGKTVRLRAWLRVEAENDGAQMRLAVDRDGFFDNLDSQPVRAAEWTRSEVVRRIDEDVRFILIGVMSNARGPVWVSDISFEVIPDR